MATITETLERSLQNCSLNHHRHHQAGGVFGRGVELSPSSDEADGPSEQNQLPIDSDTTLELNSDLSLPYDWEQWLDLKTGEIYYVNWRNGMKARDDPRIAAQEYSGEYLYSEDDGSYDSEESSSESSPPPPPPPSYSRDQQGRVVEKEEDQVLVVAGCKSCLMYFMVPKGVEDCSKCNGQLLHFDRSCNAVP